MDVSKLLAAGAPMRPVEEALADSLQHGGPCHELAGHRRGGFIGSNLIHGLIEKPEIRRLVNLDCLTYAGRRENLEGLERHPKYIFEKRICGTKNAVMDVVARQAVTHVLHLAAESHVDRSITGPTISFRPIL